MPAPAFDLQSHSTCSDGALPPRRVAAAADAGVELLALTDHDTVDGVDEALQAGAARGLAWSRHRALRRSTTPRTSTSSAISSTPTRPCSRRWPSRADRSPGPRQPPRRCAPAVCRRPRARFARSSPSRAGCLRSSRQQDAPRARGDRDRFATVGGLSHPWSSGLPAADQADRGRGHRARPRGRRRRRLGPSLLGRRGARGRARHRCFAALGLACVEPS